MRRKIWSILLVFVVSLTSELGFSQPVMADDSLNWNFYRQDISLGGTGTTEFKASGYTFKASTPQVTSFWDNSGYYDVIQVTDNELSQCEYVTVQRYDDSLDLKQTIKIENEFSLFGNAICDGDYYYILWGQDDADNKNDVVTDLVKYSLDGKKIAECKMTGYDSNPYEPIGAPGAYWGTKYPFTSGTAQMAIQDGVLSCIYAREMYNGHQSNYCFYVDIAAMSKLDSEAVTYCSHSFDQDVIATSDGGYLYANQGDASGRAFMIDYVNGYRWYDLSSESFHFREGPNRDHGYNETFAQLGGLAETGTGYILCGSSEKTLSLDNAPTGGTHYGHGEARNLFVQVLKKDFYNSVGETQYAITGEVREATGTKPQDSKTDLFLSEETKDYGVIWLTDYDDTYYVNNPKVVVTDDDKIVVLWEKLSYATQKGDTYFAVYDQNMKEIQPATELEGVYLPGNADVNYHDGTLYWVTNDSHGQYINTLDVNYEIPDLSKESAKMKECSLSLAGDISLNCYLEVSDKLVKDFDTQVVITNGGISQTMPLNSLEKVVNGKYKLSCKVPATKMKDDFTVQAVCRGYGYDTSTVSVRKYADYVLAHQNDNAEYQKSAPLVKAMLNYGAYAQKYFKYNTSALVNSGIFTTKDDPVLNNSITSTKINGFNYENLGNHFSPVSNESSSLKYYGESLSCKDATELNVYFEMKNQELTDEQINNDMYFDMRFYENKKWEYINNYTVAKKNGRFVVTINNISAQDLDRIYIYTIWGPEDDCVSYPFSPMEYIFKAMKSKDTNLSNLAKSMYWYWNAAESYTS